MRKTKLGAILCVLSAAFFNAAFGQACRQKSIEMCYESITTSLLSDLVKPPFGEIELDATMEGICSVRFPSESRCLSIVNDCPEEQRGNFTRLEDVYGVYRQAICVEDSFNGLRNLWDCLDRPKRKKCDIGMDSVFSGVAQYKRLQCDMAHNYSQCLDEVTRGCPDAYNAGKNALKRITSGAVQILCPTNSTPGATEETHAAWNSTERDATETDVSTQSQAAYATEISTSGGALEVAGRVSEDATEDSLTSLRPQEETTSEDSSAKLRVTTPSSFDKHLQTNQSAIIPGSGSSPKYCVSVLTTFIFLACTFLALLPN